MMHSLLLAANCDMNLSNLARCAAGFVVSCVSFSVRLAVNKTKRDFDDGQQYSNRKLIALNVLLQTWSLRKAIVHNTV